MAESVRTFIAVNLPDELRIRIGEFQRMLQENRGPVKWVRAEGVHITLKFLGNVEVSRISEISQVLEIILRKYPPFSMTVGGVGCFPHPKRPSVLWIGIHEGKEVLSNMAKEVDAALDRLGFPKEARPFSPHVTIARIGKGAKVQTVVERMFQKGFPPHSFSVHCVDLMKSQLTPQGAMYTCLQTFKLQRKNHE